MSISQQHILDTISSRNPDTKVGVGYDLDEMYSYSNNKNKNKKRNTFQQSSNPTGLCVNVELAAPTPVSPTSASHQEVKREEEKVRTYGREAKKDDYFVEIRAQLSHPKIGKVTRATMYFSMKTDTDMKYNIFLRSNLTSANNETMRSILGHKNYHLRDKLQEIIDTGLDNLWTGRIQYKPTNGFITKQHRVSHKYGLCAVYTLEDTMYCILCFNGQVYEFEMSDDITPAQAKFYSQESMYTVDEGEGE